jgi:hypothetical protein
MTARDGKVPSRPSCGVGASASISPTPWTGPLPTSPCHRPPTSYVRRMRLRVGVRAWAGRRRPPSKPQLGGASGRPAAAKRNSGDLFRHRSRSGPLADFAPGTPGGPRRGYGGWSSGSRAPGPGGCVEPRRPQKDPLPDGAGCGRTAEPSLKRAWAAGLMQSIAVVGLLASGSERERPGELLDLLEHRWLRHDKRLNWRQH